LFVSFARVDGMTLQANAMIFDFISI